MHILNKYLYFISINCKISKEKMNAENIYIFIFFIYWIALTQGFYINVTYFWIIWTIIWLIKQGALIGVVKIKISFKSDINLICVQNSSIQFYMKNSITNITTKVKNENRKYSLNLSKNTLTIKNISIII